MYASLCEGITENRHVYWTNACRPLHPWRFAKELIVSGTFLVSLINTEAFILHFTNPSWKVCIACLDIVFETEKKTSSMVKTIYFRKTALVSHHDYIFLNKCSIHTENVVNSRTIGKLTALLLLSFFIVREIQPLLGISSADNRRPRQRFGMMIGIALLDMHVYACVHETKLFHSSSSGVFGIDSASFKNRSGWLKNYEASQKAFRRCRVNVYGFPNVANGSRWFAKDP